VTVGRPHGINRVLPKKRDGRATIDGYAKQPWDAVILCRSGQVAVGRPCRRALQIERIGDNPRVGAVGLD
jgi:hypothetical protein